MAASCHPALTKLGSAKHCVNREMAGEGAVWPDNLRPRHGQSAAIPALPPKDQQMGTSGYISFIADNEVKNAYSHLDSGPYDLGVKMLQWLRSAIAQPDPLKQA